MKSIVTVIPAAEPEKFIDSEAILQSTDLHALTSIVRRGQDTAFEVGLALYRIKSAKLYAQTHSSWESWCDDNWRASRRHADRLITAMQVFTDLRVDPGTFQTTRSMGPFSGPVGPVSERAAREYGRVDPQDRVAVAKEAEKIYALSGGTGTPPAAVVRQAAEKLQLVPEPKHKPLSIQERRTPPWLFKALDAWFGPFELDAYAEEHNALCKRFYSAADDGSTRPWANATFANPPFEAMAPVLSHAVEEVRRGVCSTVIGPVGCSQSWFHEYAIRGTVFCPDVRINFDLPDGTPTNAADRDTMVYVFGGRWKNPSWEQGVFAVRRLEVSRIVRPED